MKQLLLAPFIVLLLVNQGCAQSGNRNKAGKVGGQCEGCEAIHESPVPFNKLSWTDTLPGFHEPGPKMVISGVIYQADGKTPARDVVLYIYHTDQGGNYTPRKEKGWGQRHGYIRGWVKTNEKGQYAFCTLRPASYPNSNAPQHIHPTIKEPDLNEYWIDEFVFDDDPNLTSAERSRPEPRGGNGVVKLTLKNGVLYGERNIVLGKNVPDYPSRP
jgi:protocatechuate 3,4-dioxygenase beta subunit